MPPSPVASAIWLRSLQEGNVIHIPEREESLVVARGAVSFRKKAIVLVRRPFQRRLVPISEVDDEYVDAQWSLKTPLRQHHFWRRWTVTSTPPQPASSAEAPAQPAPL
jgi:hypothetical protein